MPRPGGATENLTRRGRGRPKGSKNRVSPEVREWVGRLLTSKEYRDSLTRRVLAGEAPHVEKVWHESFFPKDQTIALTGAEGGPIKVVHEHS